MLGPNELTNPCFLSSFISGFSLSDFTVQLKVEVLLFLFQSKCSMCRRPLVSIMFARAVVEVAKLYDLPAVGVRKEEDKKKLQRYQHHKKCRTLSAAKRYNSFLYYLKVIFIF